MSEFLDIQIFPPWNDDKRFEQFIEDYFNELDNTRDYKTFGRSGQNQQGIDIISNEKKTVIQCKLRLLENRSKISIKRELIKTLKQDVLKFQAFNLEFANIFTKFIYATTFSSDVDIEKECLKLSIQYNINIEYWPWDKITKNLPWPIKEKYYTTFITEYENYYLSAINFPQKSPLRILFDLDKHDHLLDNVYHYFRYIYDQIGFLPIKIFKNNFPFINTPDESSLPFYSVFTLTNKNKNWFQLLKTLKIERNIISFKDKQYFSEIKDPLKKLKFILRVLTTQLVYHIRDTESHNIITICYSEGNKCTCIRCLNESQRYNEVIKKIQINPRNYDEHLKTGYTFYKMGMYLKSVFHFEKVAKDSLRKKEYLKYIFAQYSLSKLGILINNNYWNDRPPENQIKNLKNINAYTVLKTIKNENKEFVLWLFNDSFFSEKSEQIFKLVSKIRDNYYNQLNGGNSSNSHVWELINVYDELDSFVELNCIVFNRFVEFFEMTRSFIEGIFLSHTIQSKETSKLDHISDWILLKLMINGKADDIKKFFYRYELKSLKISSTTRDDKIFLTHVHNFLKNTVLFISKFETNDDQNYRFWDRHAIIFNNILVLLSITDFDSTEIRTVSQSLYEFLLKTNTVKDDFIDNLVLFIDRKGKFFDTETLIGFIDLISYQSTYHNYWYITAIVSVTTSFPNFKFSSKSLEEFIKMGIGKCEKCKEIHDNRLLPELYRLINDTNFKHKIKEAIIGKLTIDFIPDLYYYSALYDVIDHAKYFELFINAIPAVLYPSYSESDDIESSRNNMINKLANLCFKNNIDLTDIKFDKFRSLNDYYSWLFNLEGYNYDKFNPNWVSQYSLKYYLKEFSRHKKIKQHIEREIKQNSNSKLERTYLKIVLDSNP
ncbi:MAG: hypothetical protein K0R59_2746 [Sphingobacterium sp.]|jgi:hypothetical protein|nr:hypothetical protein [Sphingobacterium sp.]